MTLIYECGFNGRRETIEASSLLDAKRKAIGLFQPRRTQEHMVWVVLANRDGQPIPLNHSNAELG